MKKETRFTLLGVIKYFLAFGLFFTFNGVLKKDAPLSLGILPALLYFDFSLVLTPLLFLLSVFLTTSLNAFLSSLIGAIFLEVVFIIYKVTKTKPKIEIAVFSLLSAVPYFILGESDYIFMVVFALITVFLTLTFIPLLDYVLKKGIKSKPDFNEIFSMGSFLVIFGIGICNAFSYQVYKGIIIAAALFFSYVLGGASSILITSVSAIPLSVYFGDIGFVGLYLAFGVAVSVLMKFSRYVSAISSVIIDYVLLSFFPLGNPYMLEDFLPCIIAAAIFCAIPTKFFNDVKRKLLLFNEKKIVRQTLNRNRYAISNRLYELSGVFTEIGNALFSLTKKTMGEDIAKEKIKKDILENVCENCEKKLVCKNKGALSGAPFNKLLNIGFAKGKISFIDIPEEVSLNCHRLNDFIFCINRHLAEYRNYLISVDGYEKSKLLIANQTVGVADVLKGLAFETGQALKYYNALENKIFNALKKEGIFAEEILCFGEDGLLSVNMIISSLDFNKERINNIVSYAVGINMRIEESAPVSEEKTYLSLVKDSRYDAVFGLATKKKDNSKLSGDTHSAVRLGKSKFMVALCDGMGSGDYANKISDSTLSLIESFYRSGMDANLILNTVNKLIAINTEDSFTALDVCVFDLDNLDCAFIKFGAPYGFILNSEGIKIIEGSSLPLGILEDLKPSITADKLENGDILIFLTDGVGDSFGSSSAIIDFLEKQTAKNPQTLAENILSEAERLSNGVHNDDMTCLAVRIYEKAS